MKGDKFILNEGYTDFTRLLFYASGYVGGIKNWPSIEQKRYSIRKVRALLTEFVEHSWASKERDQAERWLADNPEN